MAVREYIIWLITEDVMVGLDIKFGVPHSL